MKVVHTDLVSIVLFMVSVMTASENRIRRSVRSGEAFSLVLSPSQFNLSESGPVQYSFIEILPAWLKVTPPETESMDVTSVQAPILYGTTVREGQEVLTVYATHLGTMQSASLTIEINVTKFEPSTLEVILLVCDMNLREFIAEEQSVLLTDKWKDALNSSDAGITKLESFSDKSIPIPLPSVGTEGVFVTASVPHEVNQKEFKICEHESNPCTSKCPSNDECDSLEVDVDSGTRYTINWCELIDLKNSPPNATSTPRFDVNNDTSEYVAVLPPSKDDYDKSSVFYWSVVLGCCIAIVVAVSLGYVMCFRRHARPYKVSDEATEKAGKAIRKATVTLRKMNIEPVAMIDWDELLLEPDLGNRPKRAASSDTEHKKVLEDSDSVDSTEQEDLPPKMDVFDSSGDDTTLRKKAAPEYRYPPSYQVPRSSQSPPTSQPVDSSRQPYTADSERVESSRDPPPTYKKPPHYGDSQSSLRSGATDENIGPAPQYQRPPQH